MTKVLLVEDDTAVRESSGATANDGFVVVTAENGKNGWRELSSSNKYCPQNATNSNC
jgi:DNA-binding response OmpR family regulator